MTGGKGMTVSETDQPGGSSQSVADINSILCLLSLCQHGMRPKRPAKSTPAKNSHNTVQ